MSKLHEHVSPKEEAHGPVRNMASLLRVIAQNFHEKKRGLFGQRLKSGSVCLSAHQNCKGTWQQCLIHKKTSNFMNTVFSPCIHEILYLALPGHDVAAECGPPNT